MSEFIITPTNIDFLESLFRNPITGKWTIPVLTFNTAYTNPYYNEIDPMNEDPNYQRAVVDNVYFRLKEKWLYKDPIFRKLLKYFRVVRSGDTGTIELVDNIDNVTKETNPDDRKYIFKYIEKYFLSKKFVDKVLRQYVRNTRAKWYDLLNNRDILKKLFAHKLKKLIHQTIYELEGEDNKPLKA